MIRANDIKSAKKILQDWRRKNYSLTLVPTMGYFHDGHIALMAKARQLSNKVIVSLFVNPAQFGPEEDLDKYPRDFDGDSKKAAAAGVDLLFCPTVPEMYHDNHMTEVSVRELSARLCGIDRPVHFSGVTTIVAKLFNIVQPDYAVFGEKDFQQLVIIKQMTADLHYSTTIIGHPIVREKSGLAMSSRNAYLTDYEREVAHSLYTALDSIRREVQKSKGQKVVAELIKMAKNIIIQHAECSIDYIAIIDSDTLKPCAVISQLSRAVGAIRINDRIRLIDNVALYDEPV
ncbi:MAG: pantoate--beta-alanine ligase [Desulfobacterales bacterium]|nr:pantoate--beta-alanine ligase [Desulfobacterales bacterium]